MLFPLNYSEVFYKSVRNLKQAHHGFPPTVSWDLESYIDNVKLYLNKETYDFYFILDKVDCYFILDKQH